MAWSRPLPAVLPDTSLLVAAFCSWHEHHRQAADDGIAGGRTYDALVVACAVRARVDRLLTLNRRDFEPIVPDAIRLEVPTA